MGRDQLEIDMDNLRRRGNTANLSDGERSHHCKMALFIPVQAEVSGPICMDCLQVCANGSCSG